MRANIITICNKVGQLILMFNEMLDVVTGYLE